MIWVSAFNTTFLCLYLVLHLALSRAPGPDLPAYRFGAGGGAGGRGQSAIETTMVTATAAAVGGGGGTGEAPAIFEAINRNGLVVFLVVRCGEGKGVFFRASPCRPTVPGMRRARTDSFCSRFWGGGGDRCRPTC